MPTPNSSDAMAGADRIKQEIDELTRKQAKVLDHAASVGMTPEEERVFVARRRLITKLVQKLRALGFA